MWLAVVAGCVAPGLMALGLFVWADAWKRSPLALNGFKCTLGSCLFLACVLATGDRTWPVAAVAWLALSSALGIVVADTLWLDALGSLGARRMIAIDALKPFLAAGVGAAVLGDRVPPLGFMGVLLASAGVGLLNFETSADRAAADDDGDGENIEKGKTAAATRRGYACAVANVVLDVAAAAITVAKHGPLDSAATNVVRFGCAALAIDGALAAAALRRLLRLRRPRAGDAAKEPPPEDMTRRGAGAFFFF